MSRVWVKSELISGAIYRFCLACWEKGTGGGSGMLGIPMNGASICPRNIGLRKPMRSATKAPIGRLSENPLSVTAQHAAIRANAQSFRTQLIVSLSGYPERES